MAYSELIKNFNKVRDYMRQFYVYGFRKREEYDKKSARSYDNERRRIESWLGEYMSFRQESSGRISFISVDSSRVRANPLYNAFKAKSFTANDIVLHFCILDILRDGTARGVSDVTDLIAEEYMSAFEEPKEFDEALVRNKLKEYAAEGILRTEKEGRRLLYRLAEDRVDLAGWRDAIGFFSEEDPMGVIGSFLLDRLPEGEDIFRFRHHYMLFALESDILCSLLELMADGREAQILVGGKRNRRPVQRQVLPLRICVSTETGRMYLLARERGKERFNMYRLDRIESVQAGDPAADKAAVLAEAEDFVRHLWNTSADRSGKLDHLEMTLQIPPEESYVLQRLKREGKHGSIEPLGDDRYRFAIDVYDASEMQPWLRTFIGRIEDLSCSDRHVTDMFREDLAAMESMYLSCGGDADAVQ